MTWLNLPLKHRFPNKLKGSKEKKSIIKISRLKFGKQCEILSKIIDVNAIICNNINYSN